MEDAFNDDNGHALLSLLKSLGEEINKVCDTEKILSGNASSDDNHHLAMDVNKLIEGTVVSQDTYYSPERSQGTSSPDRRDISNHDSPRENVSDFDRSFVVEGSFSQDSVDEPPPPCYSHEGGRGDDSNEDDDDEEPEAPSQNDDDESEGEHADSEEEWENDDDPGYIQIMISEQEFIELEEEASARLESYARLKMEQEEEDERSDVCESDSIEQEIYIDPSSGASHKLSLDLTATSPVVEVISGAEGDADYAAPPPPQDDKEEDDDEEEEEDLADDLAAVEKQMGIDLASPVTSGTPGRGYNSRLSVDDDDEDDDEEQDDDKEEEEDDVVDGEDVFVEMTDGRGGSRVGGGSTTRESDLTTSATSRGMGSHLMGSLFSTGGGSHRRSSEIIGQRKIEGVDGEHRYFDLKIIFEPYKTGFEEEKNFTPELGQIVAGRYRVVELLGQAAFSNAWQCIDTNAEDEESEWVCLKIIKNSKDFFDQSLDEIKLLQYINSKGDPHKNNVLKMVDYFYCKEHLFIVSELLRENLYEFGKYIRESGEPEYFTIPRLKKIMKQILDALKYIHSLNLIHCDIKPENIVIKSYSRCEVKLIDFGSSCFTTDHLTSYIQSRSYRAPEVILGHEYNGTIDIWSLGGVLAEMHTGYVLFQNDSLATMLARIEGILGPYPEYIMDEGSEVNRFYTSAGVAYERVENSEGGFNYSLVYPKKTTLRRRLHITSPPGPEGAPTDDDQFVDFVRSLLSVDPRERPQAGQALLHPWLDDVDSLNVEYINE